MSTASCHVSWWDLLGIKSAIFVILTDLKRQTLNRRHKCVGTYCMYEMNLTKNLIEKIHATPISHKFKISHIKKI